MGIAKLKGKIELISQQQQQQQQQQLLRSRKTSIYRVPAKLRNVEPRAYEPQFVSIGPYHRGSRQLQDSERLKWDSLNRVLVGSGARVGVESEKLLSVLDAIEPEARSCYSEEVGLSRDEFVEMMLLDGCFIVELLRDLKQNKFMYSSLLPKRWMLPVVRRDLITLENQIPMMVLKIILEETMNNTESESESESESETSLEGLALNILNPLMPRKDTLLQESIASITSSPQEFHHLLDVFHSSITPGPDVVRGKEPAMYERLSELEYGDIIVTVSKDAQPLEIRFHTGWKCVRLPNLMISKHTGTVIRNVVAYEQCHEECNPDMTTYLFFLDKVINSAEDVCILEVAGVLWQNLGISNNQVVELIKNLCLEVEHDGHHSYLHQIIEKVNNHKQFGFSIMTYRTLYMQIARKYSKNIMVAIWFFFITFLLQMYFALISARLIEPPQIFLNSPSQYVDKLLEDQLKEEEEEDDDDPYYH